MANNKLQRKRKLPEKRTSVKRHPGSKETPKGKRHLKRMTQSCIEKEIYKREFNLETRRKLWLAGHSNKQIKHLQWLREANA